MEKCGILKEYATLVDKIKRYTKEMNDVEKAIDRAVEECIKEGILADFLIGHRAEVKDVCLTEYNEVEVQNAFREEGREEGEDKLADLQKILLDANRYEDLNRSIIDKAYRKQLMSELLDCNN
jgi:hypothetical protein